MKKKKKGRNNVCVHRSDDSFIINLLGRGCVIVQFANSRKRHAINLDITYVIKYLHISFFLSLSFSLSFVFFLMRHYKKQVQSNGILSYHTFHETAMSICVSSVPWNSPHSLDLAKLIKDYISWMCELYITVKTVLVSHYARVTPTYVLHAFVSLSLSSRFTQNL